jgi:hypothetical protein
MLQPSTGANTSLIMVKLLAAFTNDLWVVNGSCFEV